MKIDEALLKKMSEGILRFGAVSEVGFKKLADFGWYVDAHISLGYTTSLMEKAMEGDVEFLNNFFIDYYQKAIKQRISSFKLKHNARLDIIKEAIDCHNEKKYYASTILFLSQADGMCGGYLFKGGNRKQELKKYLATSEYGSFFLLLLNSINQKSAIDSFYPEESGDYESDLNRHGVIHGYNTSFGTKENSLKAFSLLCFVNDFVDRY
ncbi:hypothetical protein [Maribacter arcticus]|uniref:Uncharacterized protein n=2 Tax=Maribacter arcticus TaxID=561365 RepID=A0A1T4ZQ53_9FLAO|nr:hypothetical protein [Maribacter arcticus]SKB24872.1 hypothetical protein SAMN05660866_00091 [Maribacter arcticus]